VEKLPQRDVTEKSVGEVDKTIAASPIDKFANVVWG
jgi:hypothetical protein